DVANVGPAISGAIGVEHFFVEAGERNADDVPFADDRSGVENDYDDVIGIAAGAEEGEDAVVAVVAVDPLEAVPVEIDLVEGGFGGDQVIQVANELLNASVGAELEKMPVEAAGFTPFVALSEFLAHEEKLLSGMRVLKSEEQAQVGELLPHVA